MPQLDQIATIYASQLFWLVVVFALIYFGIGRAMLPRIERTIEARDHKIGGDLAAAQGARAEADAAVANYEARLAQAREQAHAAALVAKDNAAAVTVERVKAADADIALRVAHAERALRTQQVEAIAHIEQVAIEAAEDIVARIAGLTVDRAQASAAVAQAMARG